MVARKAGRMQGRCSLHSETPHSVPPVKHLPPSYPGYSGSVGGLIQVPGVWLWEGAFKAASELSPARHSLAQCVRLPRLKCKMLATRTLHSAQSLDKPSIRWPGRQHKAVFALFYLLPAVSPTSLTAGTVSSLFLQWVWEETCGRRYSSPGPWLLVISYLSRGFVGRGIFHWGYTGKDSLTPGEQQVRGKELNVIRRMARVNPAEQECGEYSRRGECSRCGESSRRGECSRCGESSRCGECSRCRECSRPC